MADPGAASLDVGAYADAVSGLAVEDLARAVDLLTEAWERGSSVFVCGNGGSASAASHFATDLMKTAIPDGVRPLRAVALGDNPALLTAIANDIDYAEVFAHPLRALARPKDVLVVISASGTSPNVVAAVGEAASLDLACIALTGFTGGPARDLADVAIHVPLSHYGMVETAHAAATHLLTFGLRERLARRREQ